jgi:hypothetical protein
MGVQGFIKKLMLTVVARYGAVSDRVGLAIKIYILVTDAMISLAHHQRYCPREHTAKSLMLVRADSRM